MAVVAGEFEQEETEKTEIEDFLSLFPLLLLLSSVCIGLGRMAVVAGEFEQEETEKTEIEVFFLCFLCLLLLSSVCIGRKWHNLIGL